MDMLPETKQLFKVLTQLPDEKQAQLATQILEDIQWEITLNETPDLLESLIKEAKADVKAGRTYDLEDVMNLNVKDVPDKT